MRIDSRTLESDGVFPPWTSRSRHTLPLITVGETMQWQVLTATLRRDVEYSGGGFKIAIAGSEALHGLRLMAIAIQTAKGVSNVCTVRLHLLDDGSLAFRPHPTAAGLAFKPGTILAAHLPINPLLIPKELLDYGHHMARPWRCRYHKFPNPLTALQSSARQQGAPH